MASLRRSKLRPDRPEDGVYFRSRPLRSSFEQFRKGLFRCHIHESHFISTSLTKRQDIIDLSALRRFSLLFAVLLSLAICTRSRTLPGCGGSNGGAFCKTNRRMEQLMRILVSGNTNSFG